MRPLFFIILLFSLITACKSTKVVKNHQTEKEFIIKTDSIFIEKIKAINDTVFIKIPEIQTLKPECDTVCQKEIDRLLKLFYREKSSGNNKAGIYYDELQRQLVLYQNLEAQFNSYKLNNQSKTRIKEVTKEIPVKFVPKIYKILAFIGLLALGFLIIYIVVRVYINKIR